MRSPDWDCYLRSSAQELLKVFEIAVRQALGPLDPVPHVEAGQKAEQDADAAVEGKTVTEGCCILGLLPSRSGWGSRRRPISIPPVHSDPQVTLPWAVKQDSDLPKDKSAFKTKCPVQK